jgi:hypothetical protein
MKSTPVLGLAVIALAVAAPVNALEQAAVDYERTRGLVRETAGEELQLLGGPAGSWVVYSVTPPPWAVSFALAVDWWAVRPGDGLAVYVYDHSNSPAPAVTANPDLDEHWRLWQSSRDVTRFASSNPRYLLLDGPNPGGLIPRGADGALRVLLYADGGLPLATDEAVYLRELEWTFSKRDELWRPTPEWSDLYLDADAAGFDFADDLLYAEGTGRAPVEYRGTARGRYLALRAAVVEALKLAVVRINEQVRLEVQLDELPGYRVVERAEVGDGWWRALVAVPLNGPGGLAEKLGYHRLLPREP